VLLGITDAGDLEHSVSFVSFRSDESERMLHRELFVRKRERERETRVNADSYLALVEALDKYGGACTPQRAPLEKKFQKREKIPFTARCRELP